MDVGKSSMLRKSSVRLRRHRRMLRSGYRTLDGWYVRVEIGGQAFALPLIVEAATP